MKKISDNSNSKIKFSRRDFLKTLGTSTAGLIVVPYLKSSNIFAYGHKSSASVSAKVAITQATSYDRTLIKQKVQHLFESIGGIGDIVKAGNKVAIKINLTGGGGLVDNMWTHPEVLRAVGELLIDDGVNGQDIYIVESLWSDSSYNDFGYKDVQDSLGAKMVDLNNAAPYSDFVDVEVGEKSFYYDSFKLNKILKDVDVYVSIPKMKHHYEAGITFSLKNQIGITPRQLYNIPSDSGRRGELHSHTGGPSNEHLPRSICDLNLARPVNLAVIDGVINAHGGEGYWNPTFVPTEDHVLLAGKDPVATDSVCAFFMGNDPEAEKLDLPGGGECDNYLYLLNQKGVGTNKMSEIEIVGDGAGLITSVKPEYDVLIPSEIRLSQNFPNPFNPATLIRFYLPQKENVNIKIYNIAGQEVETLVDGEVPSGFHELRWSANNLASGTYIYRMQAGNFTDTKKMIYTK
jgi:uncharacterized protein (DUF362 family)